MIWTDKQTHLQTDKWANYLSKYIFHLRVTRFILTSHTTQTSRHVIHSDKTNGLYLRQLNGTGALSTYPHTRATMHFN